MYLSNTQLFLTGNLRLPNRSMLFIVTASPSHIRTCVHSREQNVEVLFVKPGAAHMGSYHCVLKD
jgi:hypothetical protein